MEGSEGLANLPNLLNVTANFEPSKSNRHQNWYQSNTPHLSFEKFSGNTKSRLSTQPFSQTFANFLPSRMFANFSTSQRIFCKTFFLCLTSMKYHLKFSKPKSYPRKAMFCDVANGNIQISNAQQIEFMRSYSQQTFVAEQQFIESNEKLSKHF